MERLEMNTDEPASYEKLDFTIDKFYEPKGNRLKKWFGRIIRKDKYLRYLLTFEAIGNLSGHTVLDVGCGTGTYMIEALNRGAEFVTGLDNSYRLLIFAKERLSYGNFKHRFILIQDKFPEIKLNRHDFAIISGGMDVIENPLMFLTELRKIVKISAFVSFPGKHRLLTPVKKLIYMFRTCRLRVYNRAEIYKLAHHAGFTEIKIKKIPSPGVDYFVTLSV